MTRPAKLGEAEVEYAPREPEGWTRGGRGDHEDLQVEKFLAGIEFVDRVALIAERLDHHPTSTSATTRSLDPRDAPAGRADQSSTSISQKEMGPRQ